MAAGSDVDCHPTRVSGSHVDGTAGNSSSRGCERESGLPDGTGSLACASSAGSRWEGAVGALSRAVAGGHILRSCDIELTREGEVIVRGARVSGKERRGKRKRGVRERKAGTPGFNGKTGRSVAAGSQRGRRTERREGQWGRLPWRLCEAIAGSIAGEGVGTRDEVSVRECEVSQDAGLTRKPCACLRATGLHRGC